MFRSLKVRLLQLHWLPFSTYAASKLTQNPQYDPLEPVPNAFLSILSTEAAAQAAINASPIRYRLIADPATSDPPASFPEESALDPSSPSSANPLPKPPPQPGTESIFELRISPSIHYNHREHILSSPLHGNFKPISPSWSSIASDLASRIPNSVAKAGLVDWVTDSTRTIGPAGKAGKGEDESKVQWGRGGGAGFDENKPWRLREKERMERENEVPAVMRGLRSLKKDEP
jgi:hypothetical protein